MSEENPFTPPSESPTSGSEVARPIDSAGVYQDGGLLVLARQGCRLPQICLKTGEPTTEVYQINQRVLPSSKTVGIAVLGGAIGLAIARSVWGEQFNLNVPMRSAAAKKAAAKSKRGWLVAGLGLLLIFIGIAVTVFWEPGIVICLAGMLIGVIGLILGGVKLTKDPFSVVNFDEKHIWIRGADKSVTQLFETFPR